MALVNRLKTPDDLPRDVLVWKWPSDALSMGTRVIVNEAQEAIFYKGGKALDLLGPGTHTLTTANLPLLNRLVNLPFGGKTPFAAEVYFVNRSRSVGHDWGTPAPIMVLDPKFQVSVPLRAFGAFSVRIGDSREFVIKVAGASGDAITAQSALNMFRSPIVSLLQEAMVQFVAQRDISVFDLPAKTHDIASLVRENLAARYHTNGASLVGFTIESINFNPKDPSVAHLREAQSEAARLNLVGDAFRLNRDFYQAEKQFDVMKTAAGTQGGAMGSAMGIGMGFGVAGSAGELARRAMQTTPSGECSACSAPLAPSQRFCPSCGTAVNRADACPACSAEVAPLAKFCGNCGQSLVATPQACGGCGALLTPAARFCPECGSGVRR